MSHPAQSSRFVVSCILLLGCYLFLSSWWIIGGQQKKASLVVKSQVVDMGVIPVSLETSKSITLSNRGDGVLQISRVETGCGCVDAVLTPSGRIPPGSEVELTISLTLRDGTPVSGFSTDILIFSNDPLTTITRLIVSARPETDGIRHADIIDFGNIPRDRLPVSRDTTITDNSNGVAGWALSMEHRSDVLHPQINVDILNEDSRSRFYRITLPQAVPTGDQLSRLAVKNELTSHTSHITIRGNIIGRAALLPRVVFLGPLHENNPTAFQVIRVIHHGSTNDHINNTGLEIVSVELSENLSALVECTTPPSNSELPVIEVSASLDSDKRGFWEGDLYGNATITLSDSTQQEVLNLPIVISSWVRFSERHTTAD